MAEQVHEDIARELKIYSENLRKALSLVKGNSQPGLDKKLAAYISSMRENRFFMESPGFLRYFNKTAFNLMEQVVHNYGLGFYAHAKSSLTARIREAHSHRLSQFIEEIDSVTFEN